jgi:hypothetical protein
MQGSLWKAATTGVFEASDSSDIGSFWQAKRYQALGWGVCVCDVDIFGTPSSVTVSSDSVYIWRMVDSGGMPSKNLRPSGRVT